MFDTDEIYERLKKGDVPEDPVAYRRHTKRLVARARNAAPSEQREERIGALRVAAALGGEPCLAIVSEYVKDPDPTLRRYAYNQTVTLRLGGLAVLRRFVEDEDGEIATEALRLLSMVKDQQCVSLCRRLLKHAAPEMRSLAVELLGSTGGKAVLVDVRKLTSDADERVRKATEGALARLAGEAEKGPAEAWWDVNAPEAAPPMPPVEEKGKPALLKPKATGPLPKEEPAEEEPEETSKPERPKLSTRGIKVAPDGATTTTAAPKPHADDAKTTADGAKAAADLAKAAAEGAKAPAEGAKAPAEGAKAPAEGAKAPAEGAKAAAEGTKAAAGGAKAPVEAAKVPVQGAKTPVESAKLPVPVAPVTDFGIEIPPEAWASKFAELPKDLPSESRALLKLLGMVAQKDRRPIVIAMSADLQSVGEVILSWRPGKEATLGRGCALAAAELQRAVWINSVSRWATADAPGVRAAVAEAIGSLGKAATIPALNQLVSDGDPGVRRCAGRAWVALGKRLGREHMARAALVKLSADKDDAVKAEAKELLAGL